MSAMLAAMIPLLRVWGFDLPASCADLVPVYRRGAIADVVCAADAPAAGLTVIDLSPTWTPVALAAGPDGVAPAYRATYLALAEERFDGAGPDRSSAEEDRFLEVYGVVPALAQIARRLGDHRRHACHAEIDDRPLAEMTGTASEETRAAARERRRRAQALRRSLAREAHRRGLDDLDALAATSDARRRRVARLHRDETYLAAVRTAQAHLACEGLLAGRDVDGSFTWRTSSALSAFQRRQVLTPDGRLGVETRSVLADDARELDHHAALRALRERVVTATGLIEDGSAGTGHATVLGHRLEPVRSGRTVGHLPLPGAAPDLIARATEAAARALGWTEASATARFFAAAVPPRVAVALPPLPDYHGPHMDLSAEIERGDVRQDTQPHRRPLDRRPALVLYVRHGGRRIPLVRWPTTIGGWNAEQLASGETVEKWKESPVGPVVWRDLYVAPSWLPPDTTPDRELVRQTAGGHELAWATIGPSYRSAYGLVMLVHHRVIKRRRSTSLADDGIRTHGSSNIASIFDGRSHGCHRLLPLYALRLAGFLLAHRAHIRRGEVSTLYRRTVRHGETFHVTVTTRGYHVELTPPVALEVLGGTIHGTPDPR